MTDAQVALYKHVNLSLQIMSCCVLFILLSFLIGKKNKTRQDRLFLTMVALHIIYIVSNLTTWAFYGNPQSVLLALNRAGLFITHITEAALLFYLFLYVQSFASEKAKTGTPKRLLWSVGALSALYVLFVVINMFNGFMYTVDDNNAYQLGKYYWLLYLIAAVLVILSATRLVRLRRYFDTSDARNLLFYTLLYTLMPVFTLLAGIVAPYLEIVYPMGVFFMLLIYVNVQVEQEKRLAEQEADLADSRAAVMLSQIQPHFLYNTLATIKTLCYKDGAAAAKLVSDFSDYLRENMDSLSQKELVSFEREIEHTRVYLDIEKMRFEERLEVVYDLEATGFELPILTVQPLVENAVHHGVTKKAGGGRIIIRSREEPDRWRITVEDDGVGFDPAQNHEGGRSHIGIENVRERLRLGCGGTLEIRSAPGAGASAVISIPKTGG